MNKIIYILFIQIILTSCGKDKSEVSKGEVHKLFPVYDEQNHPNSNYRYFLIYDVNTDELLHKLPCNTNYAEVNLSKGEYNIVGIEGCEIISDGIKDFNTVSVDYSSDGSSLCYLSKQNITLSSDSKYSNCKFNLYSGALSIRQNHEILDVGNNAYFTLTIKRPNGKRYLIKDRSLSQEECTIVSKPIYFTKNHYGWNEIPDYFVYLFPIEKDVPVTLTITFYTHDHQVTDSWSTTQPLPITSGMITSAEMNLSAYSQYPVDISIEQTPFEQTQINVGASDYIEITDESLWYALKSRFPEAFIPSGKLFTKAPCLQSVTFLDIRSSYIKDISSIYGIFKNITKLDLSYNQLHSLDLSQFPKLTELSCTMNSITKLEANYCPDLETIECSMNQLEVLNVNNCTKLKYINCYDNKIISLDVSSCPLLEMLECTSNNLQNLNIKNCNQIKELYASINRLSTLEMPEMPQLIKFYIYDNQLTELNLSTYTNLQAIECYNNQIHTLIIPKAHELTRILCQNNKLKFIDTSKCRKLEELDCSNNLFLSVDVSSNYRLIHLNCSENKLEELILGDGPFYNLNYIHFGGLHQKLTDLNITKQSVPNLVSTIYIPYTARNGKQIYEYLGYGDPFWYVQREDGEYERILYSWER